MTDSHLAENLRLLCSFIPSITSLSRRLEINRSQINKYLAGASFPRPGLLRRICDHFGVEVHEILMPPPEFSTLIRVRGIPRSPISRDLDQRIEHLVRNSDPRLLSLKGNYFEYYASMSTQGNILRTLMAFEVHDESLYYRRLERVGTPGLACNKHFRYEGMALMLGDRVFLTDYESELGVELTQSILFPDYVKHTSRMHGIKVGVSANKQRFPCAVRVYIERTPPHSSLRENLRRCGLFPRDSTDLPLYIQEAVDNRDSGPDLFLARHGD